MGDNFLCYEESHEEYGFPTIFHIILLLLWSVWLVILNGGNRNDL